MPQPTQVTYSNPATARPNAELLPPGMQGMFFARDRAAYEDQVSLQDLMQQMGAQQTIAEQPSAIAKNIATNTAESQYVGQRKREEVRGRTLENDLAAGTLDANIGLKNIELDVKKRGEALAQLRRGVEMASVLKGVAAQNNPAAMAQVMQRLGQGTDEVSQFIGGAKDNQDLMGRIDHIMNIYKALDMEYQKKLLDYRAAQARTTKETRPGIWEQNREILKRKYIREGKTPDEAEALAAQEVMKYQAKEGGLTQAPAEVQGQQALARAVAEGKANVALLPEGPLKQRMMRHYAEMEATLKGGAAPTPTPAPKPNAMPIEQAREVLKRNDTPANRKFFKETYGVEP